MTATDRKVVGVFADRAHAEAAMDALRHALFDEQDICFLSPTGAGTAGDTPIARIEHKAEDGAVSGAVTGGALGAVAGAVLVGLIPGIGQILAGGFLLGVLGGAAGGAALGTYVGPFVGMRKVDDRTARSVESQLTGGRTVVSVNAGDRVEQAADILRDHGAGMVYWPTAVEEPVAGRPW